MKEVKIRNDRELESFNMTDFKNIDGLLKIIDEALAYYDLELVLADNSDDNFWVKIEERPGREVKVKA